MATKKKNNKKEIKNNNDIDQQEKGNDETIYIKEFISKSEYSKGFILNMLINEHLLSVFEQEKIGLLKPSLTYDELDELCKKQKKE